MNIISKLSLIASLDKICIFSARTSSITEIAEVCGERKFSQYVTMTERITKGAELTIINGQLYFDNTPVVSTKPNIALSNFTDFLSSCML